MRGRRTTQFAAVVAAVAVSVCVPLHGRADGSAVPLGVDGGSFTVGGRPQFLFIVSMFDALREAGRGTGAGSALDSDFAYLHDAVHADGIRVMPNWWKGGDGRTPQFSPDSLFDPDRIDGHWARAAQLRSMHDLLDAAARHQLVVDVTFTRETMRTRSGALMTAGEYQRSVIAAIDALASHDNVMFDVQNEYSCAHVPGAPDTPVLPAGIVAQIRQGVSASYLVTASPCGDPGAVAQATHDLRLSSVAYHDRSAGWATDRVIASAIDVMRAKTKVPIYYQEPQKFEDEPNPSAFEAAAQAARRHGAAAWTFHTSAGYNLQPAGVTFRGRLTSGRAGSTLERMRAALEGPSR